MDFKQKVIEIVKNIPEGRVTTYGAVASMANTPRGARLVGGILQSNSEKSDLPWYRVINRKGYLSIKAPGYPKEAQKALLLDEGVEVSEDFVVDLDRYGWWG